MTKPVIKSADQALLPATARCHCSSFPEALSSALGEGFASKMLEWFIVSPNRLLFAAIQSDGQCTGYCSGVISGDRLAYGSSTAMMKHAYKAGLIALLKKPTLVTHPEFLSKSRFALRRIPVLFRRNRQPVRENPEVAGLQVEERTASLVIIGTSPDHRRTGVATALLQRFEEESRQRKAVTAFLSVKPTNESGRRFYERNGWINEEVAPHQITMSKNLE